MPVRTNLLISELEEWFRVHGKVVFAMASFNVLLIVFCVIYWGIDLPMYPLSHLGDLNQIYTSTENHSVTFLSIVGIFYIAYLLREIYYNQLHEQRILYTSIRELKECVMQVVTLLTDEPRELANSLVAFRRTTIDQCQSFAHLLYKIKQEVRLLRIQDIDNDENEHRNRNRENEILNKIYNEIRMLRIKQEPGAEDEEKEEESDVVVTQPTVKTRERSSSSKRKIQQ